MSQDFCNVIFQGRLGKDPELRYTQNGTPVTDFSVATNDVVNQEETTTWRRVTAWGKLAETVAQHLAKGRAVIVQGREYLEEFETQNGKGKSLNVIAQTVQFLGGNPNTEEAEKTEAKAAPRKAKAKAAAAGDTEDEIPF